MCHKKLKLSLADEREKALAEMKENLQFSEKSRDAQVSDVKQKLSEERRGWEGHKAEIDSQLQSKTNALNTAQSELSFTSDKLGKVEGQYQQLLSEFEAFKSSSSSAAQDNQENMRVKENKIRCVTVHA